FLAERDRLRALGDGDAEQLGQVFEDALGLARIEANERERGVERVEEEVRPDARLQLGEARRRLGRQRRQGEQAQPLEDRRRNRSAGERRPGAEQRSEAGAGRVRNDGEDELRRAERGNGAQADDDEPLQRHRRARELRLERADREQPDEHAGQRDAGAGGGEREPGREVRGAEHHADGHRRVDEEQRAQDDAYVADVERRLGAASARDRFWRADVAGSLAHAAMLADKKVITPADLAAIQRGLATISEEIERGDFKWSVDLEDVHLNIEARLIELAGDAGKRLHTGRSRNDQVATDIRLWLRDEIETIVALLAQLQRALVELAGQHVETVMPGFTHLQVAQPVSFAHHLLAYVEMFARDAERMLEVRARTNKLPLGAAALAGTSVPLDREAVAKALRMDGVCQNSIDAVSDRDFAIEFTSAASLAMLHVSRLSEEIVIWMSQSFGFIELADRFTTGSSIMPQKKNPDVAELARGKTSRVVGHLMGLFMLMKGQPLAYNKD